MTSPSIPITNDANPRNALDIARFLSTRLRLKPTEEYAVFEVNVDEADLPPEEPEDDSDDLDDSFWDDTADTWGDEPLDLSAVF